MFKLPSDVNKAVRAFAARASPYVCPPGDTMLQRTINPPPPPPLLNIIVLYGADEYITSAIAQRLATELGGYHQLNVRHVLKYVHHLSHDDPYKKKALVNLDPCSFEDMMAKDRYPPEMHLVEMIQQQIDDRVALGQKKFVICGMPDDPGPLWHFTHKVAEPNVVIFLDGPRPPAWHQQLADEDKYKVDKKVLSVPDWLNTEETWQNLVLVLATRVQASVKKNPPVYHKANPQKHHGQEDADMASPALPDANIERMDTPVQNGADGDLLDNLENALNSAPDH